MGEIIDIPEEYVTVRARHSKWKEIANLFIDFVERYTGAPQPHPYRAGLLRRNLENTKLENGSGWPAEHGADLTICV